SAATIATHSVVLRVTAALGAIAAAGLLLVHASSPRAASAAASPPSHDTIPAARPPPLPDDPPPTPHPTSTAPSELAIGGTLHGSAAGSDWADHVIRNVVTASSDPVETCRRGARGLALAALSPPDGHEMRVPSDRMLDRADELADKIAPSCEGD